MRFGYTIYYVADVGKTILFYENAFGLKRKFLTDDNLYGELDTGGTTLSFASVEMAKLNGVEIDSKTRNLPVEIGFVTDDVEKEFNKALSAGATLIKKPTAKPWGQIVGYVRDNNGFLIEICSPVN